MRRREFLKSMTALTIVGASSTPAVWSPAKMQSRGEILLLITENGPNNLDIHGVGTNRPGYEASWNCYDRLITHEKKTLSDGSLSYDRASSKTARSPRAQAPSLVRFSLVPVLAACLLMTVSACYRFGRFDDAFRCFLTDIGCSADSAFELPTMSDENQHWVPKFLVKNFADRDGRLFCQSKAVGAHFGLAPRQHSSGETDYSGGVSKCGHAIMRSVLYEAAHTLLTHTRRWSSLKAWGVRIAMLRGLRKATVAVARKIAVILHRMWIDSTEFRWGAEPVAV
jgi:hypothetical protein